jgi:ubiquitin C-terminal hydrolase
MKLVSFINKENTCYINAVLQCMIYTTPVPGLEEPQKVIDLTFPEHGYTLFDITPFTKSIFKNISYLRRFQQSDAHEFLVSLLDLNETFKKEYYGQSTLSIQCQCCKNITKRHEEFNTINLQVNDSLVNSFIEYLNTELHDDPKNLYFCETCKKETITKQKITLSSLPNTLIIVLKRYHTDKIHTTVDYPKELLVKDKKSGTIKKFCLTGTVNHIGNLYDGHYTSTMYFGDTIFYADDNHITKGSDAINSNAYILFYKS